VIKVSAARIRWMGFFADGAGAWRGAAGMGIMVGPCATRRGVILPVKRAEMGGVLSLDLMADLEPKGEGDNSMPGNRQLMPRRMGWRAGGSA
jgi:hypothetical protein